MGGAIGGRAWTLSEAVFGSIGSLTRHVDRCSLSTCQGWSVLGTAKAFSRWRSGLHLVTTINCTTSSPQGSGCPASAPVRQNEQLEEGRISAHRSRQGAKMRQKSKSTPVSSEGVVRDIRRATRKHHTAEEKICTVLDGLRGDFGATQRHSTRPVIC
jgi:hypothetical protein